MEDLDIGNGLGAIALVLLILREVFSFLKDKNGNPANGNNAASWKSLGAIESELKRVNAGLSQIQATISMASSWTKDQLKESRKDIRETRHEVGKLREEIRR